MKNITFIILLFFSTLLNAQNNSIFTSTVRADGFAWATTGPIEVPLPVEFIEFSAKFKENNNTVVVTWSTAVEMNNDYFVVQRSIDSYHFVDVNKMIGYGNSNVVKHYSFIDTEPYSGVSFYRLKQVDFNSVCTYTKIVRVDDSAEEQKKIFYNGKYNLLGQQIK